MFSDPGEEEKLPEGFLPFALCFCPGLVVCRKGVVTRAESSQCGKKSVPVTWEGVG